MALPRIDFGLSREERMPVILLIILFSALCVAGGASREDVPAQPVIRAFAVVVMLVQIVGGSLPKLSRYRACAWLLGAMIGLAGLQLVPLPPAIWTALPGRSLVAASPLGAAGWRPLNLVPDAGWNSLFSLLVPLSVLVLISVLEARTVRKMLYGLIVAAVFSAVLALLQAMGVAPDNPLINGSATDYAGVFANRNHQALFLSTGIVASWFWGFRRGGSFRDRQLWLAIFVILLLSISILVTGSRSGAALGALAIVSGPLFARRHRGGHRTRIGMIGWSAASAAMLLVVILLGAYFGRTLSFDRATTLSLDEDFRVRALPTVLTIAKTYLPFGSGLGSFDAVFRSAEPFALLEPTYFNHAHNDFLEAVVETGIFGPIILLAALIWLARRAVASFKQRENSWIGRLGALTIGLILVAGVSDYAARTPMIMAVLVVAACWLTQATDSHHEGLEDALPTSGKHL